MFVGSGLDRADLLAVSFFCAVAARDAFAGVPGTFVAGDGGFCLFIRFVAFLGPAELSVMTDFLAVRAISPGLRPF